MLIALENPRAPISLADASPTLRLERPDRVAARASRAAGTSYGPILRGWDKLGVDVPVVVVEGGDGLDHAGALRVARACVVALDVVLEETTLRGARAIVVRGAAEKILDTELLATIGRRLGTAALAIAVPDRRTMLLTSAERGLASFAAEVARAFGASDRPLSPTVFIADDGVLVSVHQATTRRSGLFARLFD